MNEINIFSGVLSTSEIESKRNELEVVKDKSNLKKQLLMLCAWTCFITGCVISMGFMEFTYGYSVVITSLVLSCIGMIVITKSAQWPLVMHFSILSSGFATLGIIHEQAITWDCVSAFCAIMMFVLFGSRLVTIERRIEAIESELESLEYTQKHDSYLIEMWMCHPQVKPI